MIISYLKISLRNQFKKKYYNLINILGLSLGIAWVFLISQYLSKELAYDKFHEN